MWTYVVDALADSGDLPEDETHPFWTAMDRFVDVMLAGGASVRGLSDAPAWALSYRGDGAAEPERSVLFDALALLTQARRELPQSKWNVVFADRSVSWDEVAGYVL